MASDRKGMRSIRTISGIQDRRRARTPAGALMEMAFLVHEKERLGKEIARWHARQAEITVRLEQIEERRRWLAKFCQDPAAPSAADPVPTCSNPRRLRVRELRY